MTTKTKIILEIKKTIELIISWENLLNYNKRNESILKLLYLATEIGYSAGIKIDDQEPKWPVVFVDLPTGQVSWHINEYPYAWDGHTTKEKYIRCERFLLGKSTKKNRIK